MRQGCLLRPSAAGEIVGIAGVAGNGQSELMEIAFRHSHQARGSVSLDGQAAST
jgi:ABC-type uncharacterized transport system ATPase subunit